MIQINVHSQNIRGCLNKVIDSLISIINDISCECTAILLQDIGVTGPDGPPLLRENLGDHTLYVNSKPNNKARTVAIILHKSWMVKHVYRDPLGSSVGVVASRLDTEVLLVSAYLPASLDLYGFPGVWDPENGSATAKTQEEAHSIYSSILDWTSRHQNWLVGGDLNETRTAADRKRSSDSKSKPS